MTARNPVTIGPVQVGRDRPLALIAGPCVMEPGDMTLRIAIGCVEICAELHVPARLQGVVRQGQPNVGVEFSRAGAREGMKVFERVKAETGLPVTTDLHETSQASRSWRRWST